MFGWFSGGKKKKENTLEEKYAEQLAQLHKKGYTDDARNIEKLELYAGDANLVVIDYEMESSTATKQSTKSNESTPTTTTTTPTTTTTTTTMATSHTDDTRTVKAHPEMKHDEVGSHPTTTTTAATTATTGHEKKTGVETTAHVKPETHPEQKSQHSETQTTAPKTTETKPTPATTATPSVESKKEHPIENVTLLNNLKGLHAYDLRDVLHAMGQEAISEILYSYAIDGKDIYDTNAINTILNQVDKNRAFQNQQDYIHFVHEIEKSFQKYNVRQCHSAINSPNVMVYPKVDVHDCKVGINKEHNYQNMVASQVCELLREHHPKLAERLYSYSVDGATLLRLSYKRIITMTGISTNELSEKTWKEITTSLNLPQISEAELDASEEVSLEEIKALEQKQINILTRLEDMHTQVGKITSGKKQSQKPGGTDQKMDEATLIHTQTEQLRELLSMQDNIDRKTLPPKLYELKQRQNRTIHCLEQMFSDNSLFPDRKEAFTFLMEISDRSEEASLQQLNAHKANPTGKSSNESETSKKQDKKGQKQDKKGQKQDKKEQTQEKKGQKQDKKGQKQEKKGQQQQQQQDKKGQQQNKKGQQQDKKGQQQQQSKKGAKEKESKGDDKSHKNKGGKEENKDKNVTSLTKRYDDIFSRLKTLSSELSTYAEVNNINLPKVAPVSPNVYNMKLTPENVKNAENRLSHSMQRLLHLAVQIKSRGDEHNISLPQQELVDQLCVEIAGEFEQNQNHLIQRLEDLLEKASMLSEQPVEVNRPKTSRHHSRRSSLLELPLEAKIEMFDHYPADGERSPLESREEKEVNHIDEIKEMKEKQPGHRRQSSIKITSAVETEKEIQDLRSRKKSLQIGVSQLRSILTELGVGSSGDSALLTVALQQLNVFNETADKTSLPTYIESVISSVSDESGQINYEQMCEYLSEPTLTRSLSNNEQWNEFRKSLIGRMRMSNHLRINYRLDGWPQDKKVELDDFKQLTDVMNNNSQIELSQLMPFIQRSFGKDIDVGEVRAKSGANAPWEKTQSMLPVSFAKDGWAQVFLWIKTQSLLAKKGGVPFE